MMDGRHLKIEKLKHLQNHFVSFNGVLHADEYWHAGP